MKPAKTMNPLVKGLPLAALSATVLAAHPADAAIIGTKGQVEIVDTPVWLLDKTPKSFSLQAFDEEQNVVLPQDVQISDPTNWDRLSDLDVIPKGTRVSSHFIYFANPIRERRGARATITFDGPILGLIGDPAIAKPTFEIFFPNPNALRNDIGGTLDRFPDGGDLGIITGDRGNVLDVYLTTHVGREGLRVITQAPAAPEPLTILGTGTALGFAPLLKRAYSKKKNKEKNKD